MIHNSIIISSTRYLLLPKVEGIKKAAIAGYKVLLEEEAKHPNDLSIASQAVIQAIKVMEDHEAFNSGYGSFLNEHGEIEMDAGIMDGRDLESGAVAGIGMWTCMKIS